MTDWEKSNKNHNFQIGKESDFKNVIRFVSRKSFKNIKKLSCPTDVY